MLPVSMRLLFLFCFCSSPKYRYRLTCLGEECSLDQRAVSLLVVMEEREAGLHAEGVGAASVHTTTHWVDQVVCKLVEGRGGEGRGGEGRGGEGRGGEGREGEGREGGGERGEDGSRGEANTCNFSSECQMLMLITSLPIRLMMKE